VSQESVSVVRRLFEAWDHEGFGVIRALMDPDIEYVNPPYAVEPGTRVGYDGFAIAAQAIHAVYPDRRLIPLEFRVVGDRVAVRARVLARGVSSSLEVDTERGYAFEVRDGRVARFAWFNDPAEALEAVGLAAEW
jgi:ketosteroid isomerase-like protein